MKTTYIKTFINTVIFSLFIISCEIDRFPSTSISDTNFWNTESDIRTATNYFYSTLPGLAETSDVWSADAYPNSNPNSISDGSRVTPTTSADYNYSNIYRANNLIEKAQVVINKGGDATAINRYVGEARFFRAWYYFEMLKRFGGIPIITRTLLITDTEEIYKPRATREEVLDLIYSDLDYAISVLRDPDELNTAKEYGRISNTAAMAFKARVALFEGTRAKYHNYGDWQKHLNLAKISAEEVINSGFHDIYSTPIDEGNGKISNDAYYNLFQEKGEGRANRENIIVRIYGENNQNNIISHVTQRTYEGNTIVPTHNLVSNYLMADGLPQEKSALYTEPNTSTLYKEYFNKRDPRMSFSLFKEGDEYVFSGDFKLPNPTFNRTGYAIRKYANKNDWNTQRSFIDRPVLRYAEILLIYAETLYELQGNISDEQLNQTINKLRERLPSINIGDETNPNYQPMEKLTNSLVTSNGLNMLEEIRRERRIELAFEGFRYWDLIRWKTAENELPKTIYGSYLFQEFIDAGGWKPTPETPVDSNNYIIIHDASLRRFDSARDYLWPLPNIEIAKNPSLEQNPGW